VKFAFIAIILTIDFVTNGKFEMMRILNLIGPGGKFSRRFKCTNFKYMREKHK